MGWYRAVKFAGKRRRMQLDRAEAKLKAMRASWTLLAWKEATRETRMKRRNVIQNYLVWRAKRFLRAWREVTEESLKENPERRRVGGKTVEEEKAGGSRGESPAATAASSPRSVTRERKFKRVTVADMQQRLWTKADPSKPMPSGKSAVKDVEEELADDTTATTATTTETTTAPDEASEPAKKFSRNNQRVVVQRRKKVLAASTATNEQQPESPAARVKMSAPSKETLAIDNEPAMPVAPPAQQQQGEQQSSSLDTVTSSSSSSMSASISVIIVVVLALALFGAVALLSTLTGVSIVSGGHSSATEMVRQHLSEAQRNVTILARASAMQRRELEACRTFGGGVPDASQNAAIASAEAKVSDSVVHVADLEMKLSQAKAETAQAISAKNLAEDRLKRLGSGALDAVKLQESLQKMTTRATYCETTSAQALKLKTARDAAVSRAEKAEEASSRLRSQLAHAKTNLDGAQKALVQTTEVANTCRYQIGKSAYVPSYQPEASSFWQMVLDLFPSLRTIFSVYAFVFYAVCGYAYYARVVLEQVVAERDRLVTEVAKMRMGGGPTRFTRSTEIHHSTPVAIGLDDSDASDGETATNHAPTTSAGVSLESANSFDRKRSRSLSDINMEDQAGTALKKTATEDGEEDDEQEEDVEEADEGAAAAAEESEPKAGPSSVSFSDQAEPSTERSVRLIERWVEKSQDQEIKDELLRIRRLVELEDEREVAQEQADMERLKVMTDGKSTTPKASK